MINHSQTIREKINILSVVIIARNEARNIARAIESVLYAIRTHPGTEVLLVDSASTDETIEIARRYPINIVRLDSSWFLSVPAGRHIGMHYTRGELVLHMDGDMELDPEWVNRSLSYLAVHPEVGAVGGYYRNVYMQNGEIIGEQDIHRDPSDRIKEVRYVGGAAVYRRSAIVAMGGFQPYIRGEEGVYISMGIRNAGYKVVQLPYLMSRHYCVPPQSLAYSLRRLRMDMWLGFGQVPRYYWGTSLFWTYLRERGAYIIYLLGALISLVTLALTLIKGDLIYFGAWLIIVTLFLLVFVIKKRSLRKTLISLIAYTGIAISAVRGFMIKPHLSADYPTNVEFIKIVQPAVES
jgi:glycosyltransferase involved in cell wall biosynthesis